MKKIMFTGGGSAGHVTVNLALIPRFQQEGWDVVYVGSKSGIERQLVTAKQIRYIGISSGKLRRYFDVKNFSDPLRVLKGAIQAFRIIRKERPDVLFSKGGFVSVPVVIGAWLNRVPIVIHESDYTPGLANRICMRYAHTICTTFHESTKYFPKGKTHHVGAVVREELCQGNPKNGRDFLRLTASKPILLLMGGSLGARKMNDTIRSALTEITRTFHVVHLCGRGNIDSTIASESYRQYEYLNEELPDVLAAADVVVSRAGSNSIFEFLQLQKPMLLIPLTKEQSRGDQILNARSFESAGFCKVLYEEQMTPESMMASIHDVYAKRNELISNMKKGQQENSLAHLFKLIQNAESKAQ